MSAEVIGLCAYAAITVGLWLWFIPQCETGEDAFPLFVAILVWPLFAFAMALMGLVQAMLLLRRFHPYTKDRP